MRNLGNYEVVTCYDLNPPRGGEKVFIDSCQFVSISGFLPFFATFC